MMFRGKLMVIELVSLALIYFAVIDPIGKIPIFLSITERFDYKQKRRVALRGCAIAFFVLVFFGFFGDFTSLDKSVINLSSIFIALVSSALLLYLAAWGLRFINLTISTVMSRLVGILLAAIAIQIILNGLNVLGIITI